MPEFWTVFGAALGAHVAAIVLVCLFIWYDRGEPQSATGLKVLDKTVNVGIWGFVIMVGGLYVGGMLYAFCYLALDVLRIWGFRN